MSIEVNNKYLIDTCTLLFWIIKSPQLPKKILGLLEANQRVDGILASSISIWEIAIKVKKKKLELGMDVNTFYEKIKETRIIKFIPVDEKIWLGSTSLNWRHKDHADKVIVYTAMQTESQLITPDKEIKKFYKNCVW